MPSKTKFCLLNLRTYLIYLCCYLLIVVAAGSRVVNGLKCYCNPKECDVIRSLDCPGKGLIIWDPCKCCRICAKTLGEACGGPGEFSGQCEPPLKCMTKLPINSELGVCINLSSFSSSHSTYHKNRHHNCTKHERIAVDPGCEIINKRCQCWPRTHICPSASISGVPTTDIRWHFKTSKECLISLRKLIKIEMEFDEDYTISPSTFTYKKFRRKNKSRKKHHRKHISN